LDCRKYQSNGTPKKNLYGKDAYGKSCGPKKPHQGGSSYAQLSAKKDKQEKSNKKLKHSQKKKHRHHHNHSSSDSDDSSSSLSYGYGSTVHVFKKDNCSRQKIGTCPIPIKTTKRINSTFIALENT
jgi:hypothetical protein